MLTGAQLSLHTPRSLEKKLQGDSVETAEPQERKEEEIVRRKGEEEDESYLDTCIVRRRHVAAAIKCFKMYNFLNIFITGDVSLAEGRGTSWWRSSRGNWPSEISSVRRDKMQRCETFNGGPLDADDVLLEASVKFSVAQRSERRFLLLAHFIVERYVLDALRSLSRV